MAKNYWGEKEELLIKDYLTSKSSTEKEKVLRNLYPKLKRLSEEIVKRYGRHLKEDRETLFVDTLTHVFKQLEKFKVDNKTKAYSYLGTIAKNYLYTRGKLEKRNLSRGDELILEVHDFGEDQIFEQDLLDQEQEDNIRFRKLQEIKQEIYITSQCLLSGKTEQEKEIFSLTFQDNFSIPKLKKLFPHLPAPHKSATKIKKELLEMLRFKELLKDSTLKNQRKSEVITQPIQVVKLPKPKKIVETKSKVLAQPIKIEKVPRPAKIKKTESQVIAQPVEVVKVPKPRKINNTNSKKIIQYTPSGQPIKEWDSVKKAATELKLRYVGVSDCLTGKRYEIGGFRWGYSGSVLIEREWANKIMIDDDYIVTRKTRLSVSQFSLSGEFIKIWHSLTFASKALSIPRSRIISCCEGKKESCGQFKWKYDR